MIYNFTLSNKPTRPINSKYHLPWSKYFTVQIFIWVCYSSNYVYALVCQLNTVTCIRLKEKLRIFILLLHMNLHTNVLTYFWEVIWRNAVCRIVNSGVGCLAFQVDFVILVHHVLFLANELRRSSLQSSPHYLNDAVNIFGASRRHAICAFVFKRIQKTVIHHLGSRVKFAIAYDGLEWTGL